MTLPISASIRQFARAVVADRLAGDELAYAVADKAELHSGEGPSERAALFRQFILKWRDLAESRAGAKPFSNAELVKSMGGLPNLERVVLLLHDLCGFSRTEIEYVLDPLERSFDDLLEAGRSVTAADHTGKSAVIIEDEPLIAADLKDVLEGMGINVVALARTAEQGSRDAIRHRPDLVLADYNLDGGRTGVDAVVGYQERHDCPVIFITGYPDEVLKGEEVEPDFVIVKPYSIEAVRAAVAHCLGTPRLAILDADGANQDK